MARESYGRGSSSAGGHNGAWWRPLHGQERAKRTMVLETAGQPLAEPVPPRVTWAGTRRKAQGQKEFLRAALLPADSATKLKLERHGLQRSFPNGARTTRRSRRAGRSPCYEEDSSAPTTRSRKWWSKRDADRPITVDKTCSAAWRRLGPLLADARQSRVPQAKRTSRARCGSPGGTACLKRAEIAGDVTRADGRCRCDLIAGLVRESRQSRARVAVKRRDSHLGGPVRGRGTAYVMAHHAIGDVGDGA